MTTAKQQEALWMIPQDIYQVFKHMNTVIPMAILLIEDDDDRMLLSQLYTDHRKLMFAVAKKYMGKDKEDLDEAISSTIERISCATKRKMLLIRRWRMRSGPARSSVRCWIKR